MSLAVSNSAAVEPPTAAHSATTALPPVIVFGGNDNALSIVRRLGSRSIPVYVLNHRRADVQYSRYARPCQLRTDLSLAAAAVEFLLGEQAASLQGAVLLAASDQALEQIAEHRQTLATRYLLDLSNPIAQQAMLDKLATYKLARQAGVPTPEFWEIASRAEIDACRQELVYPLIVKPVLSHLFQQKFNTKFIVANDFEELCEAYQVVEAAEIDVMLVEQIPGPDSQLCSYYTYLDEQANTLFDFTKRIIRRYPTNMGLATYHVTDHVEGVGELALRLFRHAELRGLANAEFKLDQRDGQLKLIECNARFTAANALIDRAGLDLSSLVYNRLVGLPLPALTHFKAGLTLWDPFRDFRAYRELSKRGELSFYKWLRSIARRQMFPGFAWTDPQPGIRRMVKRLRKRRPW